MSLILPDFHRKTHYESEGQRFESSWARQGKQGATEIPYPLVPVLLPTLPHNSPAFLGHNGQTQAGQFLHTASPLRAPTTVNFPFALPTLLGSTGVDPKMQSTASARESPGGGVLAVSGGGRMVVCFSGSNMGRHEMITISVNPQIKDISRDDSIDDIHALFVKAPALDPSPALNCT